MTYFSCINNFCNNGLVYDFVNKMSSSEQSTSSVTITTVFQIYINCNHTIWSLKLHSAMYSTTTFDDNTISIDSEIADYSRIGNTSWCSCEKCFPMSTYTESLCYRDTNEVADEYFERNHNS